MKPDLLFESDLVIETPENVTRWGMRQTITVQGVELEVFGAISGEVNIISHTLNQVPQLHVRQIPRIVIGDRVGPIGTGRIRRGGNSARRGGRESWRLELTHYALRNKVRSVQGRPACYTLLHELGHWVDWQLGLYPSNVAHRRTLRSWFDSLNYPGVTQGRGEQVAEAYWRYFLGGLPPQIARILEAAPAFRTLQRESIWNHEVTPTTELTTDNNVAVQVFSQAKRIQIDTPILSPASNASARSWNNQRHPSSSGVSGTLLRTQLARYIDFSTVLSAILAHNSSNPADPIEMGTDPFDAVCAEAIHQFQKKCFIDNRQHDGKAGAMTLDSLGLINRSGMNPYNRVNATSRNRLRTVGTNITVSGSTVNHSNWFDFIMNPTVFGWQSSNGLHYGIVLRLRQAENHLISQSRYRDMTPVELGRALGIPEAHKGYRPTKTNGSMHNYGLALDIDYTGNPWVKSIDFWNALKRSSRLITGNTFWVRGTTTLTSATRYYHHLAQNGGSTSQIYDELKGLSTVFQRYLGYHNDLAGLTAFIAGSSAPAGVKNSGETDEQAARRWHGSIRSDYSALNRRGNFVNRDVTNGFLNINKDLVIALRDHSCMAWGGIDFGNAASGDMMHFDVRSIGPFDALSRAGGGSVPGTFHPCRSRSTGTSEDLPSYNDYDTDLLEKTDPGDQYVGPASPTGAGSAFDLIALQMGGLEAEALTARYTLNDTISSFRKIYYNSRTAARSYAGAIIGGGAWNILIPGASGVTAPSTWSGNPTASGAVTFLRRNQVIATNSGRVDIGHLLAGLDAGNHPSSLSLAGGIVSMRSNKEAVTFIGDLGSVVVEYLYGSTRSFYDTARRLNNTLLRRKYREFAGVPDMNGNVDAYALRLNRRRSLTENLVNYYAHPSAGARKRYTAFTRRIGWGTLGSSGFSGLNQTIRNSFKEEIFNAALAYAAATGRRGDVLLVLNNPGPGLITPGFWEAYWNISGWVLDHFISDVAGKVRSE